MRFTSVTAPLLTLVVFSCGTDARIVDEADGTETDEGALTALSVAPTALVLVDGKSATATVTTAGGGAARWDLSTLPLPAGVTARFAPTRINGRQSSTLTLVARGAVAGNAKVTVVALSVSGTRRSVLLNLTVRASMTDGGVDGGTPTKPDGGVVTELDGGTDAGSPIGPNGGTVALLRFAVTGDTRPPDCNDNAGYPTAIINAIADGIQRQQAQFALDLGDHMFVCNNRLADATTQMRAYMQATRRFSSQWFMTMGNHECSYSPCLPGSSNANYVAFMSALAPVSPLPYYSFNIDTRLGRATFIVLADDSWDATQSAWFERTLATADAAARYTIVARHHPPTDRSVSTNGESMTILRRHKFALFLSGHDHTYRHLTADDGRDVTIGIGGAPLVAPGTDFNGYAMVEQQPSGKLRVSVYDLSGGALRDSFSVNPNQ